MSESNRYGRISVVARALIKAQSQSSCLGDKKEFMSEQSKSSCLADAERARAASNRTTARLAANKVCQLSKTRRNVRRKLLDQDTKSDFYTNVTNSTCFWYFVKSLAFLLDPLKNKVMIRINLIVSFG